jgi:hypothetical protein
VHDCGVWSRRGQHQAEAVKAGDRDAVRVLLAQHEDVKAPEPDGTTALHWAVLSNDPVTVRLLLQASANVDAANRYGVTPLQIAATNGNPKVIEALLEAGADPNVVLPEGKTVLMTAARSGRVEAVNLLLAYGADASAKEQLVRRNGPHLGCCRESCGRGARVGQEWRRRQRPLEYADLAASGRTARRVDAADVCGPSGCARRGARSSTTAVRPSMRPMRMAPRRYRWRFSTRTGTSRRHFSNVEQTRMVADRTGMTPPVCRDRYIVVAGAVRSARSQVHRAAR